MTTIASAHQLPEWFELSAYDVCDSFTGDDWANELKARRFEIAIALTERIAGHREVEYLVQPGTLRTHLDLSKPCRHKTPDWESLLVHLDQEVLFTEITAFDTPAVRPTLCIEMLAAAEKAEDCGAFDKDSFTGYDEIQARHPNPSKRAQAFLTFDLTAPDAELKKQLKSALEAYRAKMGIPNPGKSGSAASVEKLRQYKVLAYLDLLIWADIEGHEITAKTYDEALYPREMRGERFILDTLRPWAYAAIKPGFIRSLRTATT